MTTEWDELSVEFFVKKSDGELPEWQLMLRRTDVAGSASWILQRWRSKPRSSTIDAAIGVATQALGFLTVQLDIGKPMYMQIKVPRIRVRIKGVTEPWQL